MIATLEVLDVRWIRDEHALHGLREAWVALSARSAGNLGFFATWDYVAACVRVLQPNQWCVVAVLDSAQRLVGVFPLQLLELRNEQTGLRWRACQTLGAAYVPYIEFPMDCQRRREVTQALLQALRQQAVEVLLLWPLHERSWLYQALLEDFRASPSLMTLRFPGNVHEIHAEGMTIGEYFADRKSSTLSNAHYCERRLRRAGEATVTLRESQNLPALVAQLCAWNHERFGQQHLFPNGQQWAATVSELVCSLQPTGAADLTTLRLDGRVIASALSFLHKRRRYFYLYAFDAAFSAYSPGKIVLAHLVEETFRRGGEFCFGLGDYAYKRDWSQTRGEVKAAALFFNPEARAGLESYVNLDMLRRLANV